MPRDTDIPSLSGVSEQTYLNGLEKTACKAEPRKAQASDQRSAQYLSLLRVCISAQIQLAHPSPPRPQSYPALDPQHPTQTRWIRRLRSSFVVVAAQGVISSVLRLGKCRLSRCPRDCIWDLKSSRRRRRSPRRTAGGDLPCWELALALKLEWRSRAQLARSSGHLGFPSKRRNHTHVSKGRNCRR